MIAANFLRKKHLDRDLTPEHTKRNTPDDKPTHGDVTAAYAYVHGVVDTSDYENVLAWHGWALRESFLAGITFSQNKEWQPIETAPSNKPLWVFYKNSNGMGRTVKAEYVGKFTIEYLDDDTDFGDYNEEKDMWFCPAGWYELIDNHSDFSHLRFEAGNKPTHWMPLPEVPGF